MAWAGRPGSLGFVMLVILPGRFAASRADEMSQFTPGGWSAYRCGAEADRTPVQPAGRRPVGSGPGPGSVLGLLRPPRGGAPGAVHRRDREPGAASLALRPFRRR